MLVYLGSVLGGVVPREEPGAAGGAGTGASAASPVRIRGLTLYRSVQQRSTDTGSPGRRQEGPLNARERAGQRRRRGSEASTERGPEEAAVRVTDSRGRAIATPNARRDDRPPPRQRRRLLTASVLRERERERERYGWARAPGSDGAEPPSHGGPRATEGNVSVRPATGLGGQQQALRRQRPHVEDDWTSSQVLFFSEMAVHLPQSTSALSHIGHPTGDPPASADPTFDVPPQQDMSATGRRMAPSASAGTTSSVTTQRRTDAIPSTSEAATADGEVIVRRVLECTACHELSQHVVARDGCQHPFCSRCAVSTAAFRKCCDPSPGARKPAHLPLPQLVRRLLEAVVVHCPHGCGRRFKGVHIASHIRVVHHASRWVAEAGASLGAAACVTSLFEVW